VRAAALNAPRTHQRPDGGGPVGAMERYREVKALGKGTFGQVFLVNERSGLK